MSKNCIHCGASLPDEAAFCPHCAQSQQQKKVVRPPRLWRKKALIAALCVTLTAFIALVCALLLRPKTFEGGATVVYTDQDGTYELLVTFHPSDIANNRPIGEKSVCPRKNIAT